MSAQLLRARIVWPVSTPPIENGAISIFDGLIEGVGPWPELSRRRTGVPVDDLGEVVLMPGLVNAHCHLDYTGMAGMIPPPSSSANFPDWIKSILSLKAHWSYTEYAASWLKGAKQLLDSGCTTVFDTEAVPELLPEAWQSTPLRVISYLEMTGVRSGHQPERILREASQQRDRIGETALCSTGISPHALYSTPPALLKLVAQRIRSGGMRVSMHLAESEAEWDMYQNARGPLYEWLKSQRPMDDCGGRSPVQRAHELGLLQPNLLAIHCNYLARGDAELLAKNQVTVVHCPRSHAYFKHAPFPYEQLRAAGVNIMIATDSLASVRVEKGREASNNLWDEMRAFSRAHKTVPPEKILEMTTCNIGRWSKNVAGQIAANDSADLIAVMCSGRGEDLAERLVAEGSTVKSSWVGGIRASA